ncbi:lactoylglutathione lyase [Ancylobacter sp. WKF20]|uniref:VOC family protein n=1 Tax=Ancylobacter sp. WKF20 TaxID=3039801 RepID=UPI0024340F4F|nr:VOC family protein [Ancylobacter sp. WKF20]WGD29049.1 lactoylglutathione lyase [Ancylobacter sp. WKF20]
MPTLIFINLPVHDLDRAIAFYEAIGARKNPQFSDDTAACMVVSDVIHLMLLTHPKFAQFSPRPIADSHATTSALFALTEESRAGVDAVVAKAAAGGGKADPRAPQDLGFMYSRSFEDPDGHVWEPFFMDMAALPAEMAPAS